MFSLKPNCWTGNYYHSQDPFSRPHTWFQTYIYVTSVGTNQLQHYNFHQNVVHLIIPSLCYDQTKSTSKVFAQLTQTLHNCPPQTILWTPVGAFLFSFFDERTDRFHFHFHSVLQRARWHVVATAIYRGRCLAQCIWTLWSRFKQVQCLKMKYQMVFTFSFSIC